MRPRIIAELSCNHHGSLDTLRALVKAAADAGADGVKLQTWTPGSMVLAPNHIIREGPWAGRDLSKLYEEAHTPWEWHKPIFDYGRELGIQVFSAPFDHGALAFLEELGCPAYKVASFEILDHPLIKAIARTGKPIILSTGMASTAEIDDAVSTAYNAGARDITLLKCSSAYPASAQNANLSTMHHMAGTWSRYQVNVGLSDHTPGIGVAMIAAAMGAVMIEKHLVLPNERTLDEAFSITPDELAFLCREAPRAAAAIGEPTYGAHHTERAQLALRRSLYFARDLAAGQTITEADLATARPAGGVHPKQMGRLIGREVTVDVKRGDPVTLTAIAVAKPEVTA